MLGYVIKYRDKYIGAVFQNDERILDVFFTNKIELAEISGEYPEYIDDDYWILEGEDGKINRKDLQVIEVNVSVVPVSEDDNIKKSCYNCRLKTTAGLVGSNNWGYMCDKYKIPLADGGKENELKHTICKSWKWNGENNKDDVKEMIGFRYIKED